MNDEALKLRGILEWMLQYVPNGHRQTVLRQLEACKLEGARYPAHDMARALREIGAMIPSSMGGTFEQDSPGAIVAALREALSKKAYNAALAQAATGCGCLFAHSGEHYPSCAQHPAHPNALRDLQGR